MPYVTASDGIKLYYEETGSGLPIVFVHEFAGDHRSYEAQMRHFGRRYRCVAYNARGYPPSDVPTNPASYSQDRARDDILAILDGLGLTRAHIVGISMGGFATLHFGLNYSSLARSLVVAGCGYGAAPDRRAQFQEEAEAAAGASKRSILPSPPRPTRSVRHAFSCRTRMLADGSSSARRSRNIRRSDQP